MFGCFYNTLWNIKGKSQTKENENERSIQEGGVGSGNWYWKHQRESLTVCKARNAIPMRSQLNLQRLWELAFRVLCCFCLFVLLVVIREVGRGWGMFVIVSGVLIEQLPHDGQTWFLENWILICDCFRVATDKNCWKLVERQKNFFLKKGRGERKH